MTEGKFSFLILDIILLIVFVGFIRIIFDMHRFFFIAEFLFLGALMLVALISIVSIYNDIKFGWTLLSFVFTLILVDLLVIYLLKSPKTFLFMPTAITALIGFIISAAHIKGPEKSVEKIKVKKEFKPGKFIASKSGKKFHSPKCEWAKKIKKANAVWFNSKEEAKKAGYKVDDCISK